MSLSEYAKRKALDFARETYKQANPNQNVEPGSPIRALLLKPFSVIYAAIFQDLENLREMYLGNYDTITEAEMDQLAENLLEDRPEGSRSVTNVRVFLEQIEPFSVRSYPYFSTDDGTEFMPVSSMSFAASDILEEDGEPYVDIPVISRTFGPTTSAAAGEITNTNNFPVGTIRTTNPQPTSGGDDTMTNAEFFTYLQDAVNDGSINQVGGIRQWVVDEYPEISDVRVVTPTEDDQMRDELWQKTAFNDDPTLDYRPEESWRPMTTLESMELYFDKKPGRVIADSGHEQFKEEDEGKRIFIDQDTERYRTVLKVIDEDEAIISGPALREYVSEPVSADLVREDGPHVKNAADVYMYAPTLFIRSATVDNRYFLTIEEEIPAGAATSAEYSIQEGYTYTNLPEDGKAVFREATDSEEVLEVVDLIEGDIYLSGVVDDTIPAGTNFVVYDQDPISIKPDGDIDQLPVVYVVSVEKIDPITGDVVDTIPRTQPGEYDEPGWVLTSKVPQKEFSPRENKEIELLEKKDVNGFEEKSGTKAGVKESSYVDTRDVIQKGGENFDGMEGREVSLDYRTITIPQSQRGWEDSDDDDAVVDSERVNVSSITEDKIVLDERVFEYFVEKEYRDKNLDIKTVNNAGSYGEDVIIDAAYDIYLTNTYTGDDVKVYGKTIEAKPGTSFVENGVNEVAFHVEEIQKDPGTIEAPLARADGNEFEVIIEDGGLPGRYDGSSFYAQTDYSFEDETGDFETSLTRVVYATHPDIRDAQNRLEDGNVRDLCEHTLARSMNPTLIDTNIQYSGSATADQIRSRFIDLIQSSVTEFSGEVQLSLSNVIAALDEEGLTDSVELDFEVKMTHFLSDGEKKIQYVNPDKDTKQELSIKEQVSQGDKRVKLTEPDVDPEGRGKLMLGGNNPNTQEVLPYEAIVENDDGSITAIIRGGLSADYAHPKWEEAVIAVRDYETEFEIQNDTIKIPPNNRPYVREVVVEKL